LNVEIDEPKLRSALSKLQNADFNLRNDHLTLQNNRLKLRNTDLKSHRAARRHLMRGFFSSVVDGDARLRLRLREVLGLGEVQTPVNMHGHFTAPSAIVSLLS